MGKFIGATGLAYLWEKIKNFLATSLSVKADKATTLAGYGITDAINTSSTAQTKAGSIKASKFITSGGTSSQVVRGDGSLVDPKLLPQYEAYLEWGGKNFTGSYGPIDAAMVSELGAPRTMFAKAAGIVVEYSTDGGSTWIDYGATNEQKVALFSVGQSFYTGKNSTAGGASINNMLRVSLYTSAASIYTVLNKFVIYVSTNGSSGCYCTIRCRTQQNYEDNVDTWVTKAEQVPIQGWSGYNVINTSAITTYGNVKASHYGELQFIFGCTGISSTGYSGLTIQKIFGFGGVGWTTPSNMAKTGHLYSFDANQNATFPSQVTATSFKRINGTSSQFLKADGSVDSNTYLTSYTETDPTVPSWAKASTKPSYTASEVGALPDDTQLFSGDYNDLTNKPTIPSAVTESTVSGWGFTKNTGTVTYTEDT